ncbi:MAG: TIGR00269 family protein [Candidatus Nanohalarchaeota archaeon]|nr:MAG: TIGR00269 family protein [Candidatus Nanohaloarchaeota archaeon]
MTDKKFIEDFEKNIRNTIRDYRLLAKSDKIIVACSGGKDSIAVLYLLKKFGYDVSALILDLEIGNWSKKNLDNSYAFCDEHDIKLHRICAKDELGYSIEHLMSCVKVKRAVENCTVCGVIKRWLINKTARELGADKLVTGHNLDDEAQTVFMNILKGNPLLSAGLGPKSGVGAQDMFVQRVKPLYFCTDTELRKYTEIMGFNILYSKCPLSSAVFRRDIKNCLDNFEKDYPDVKINIVRKYLKMKPALVKAQKSKEKGKIKRCSVCGEPARGDVCKACEFLRMVSDDYSDDLH